MSLPEEIHAFKVILEFIIYVSFVKQHLFIHSRHFINSPGYSRFRLFWKYAEI